MTVEATAPAVEPVVATAAAPVVAPAVAAAVEAPAPVTPPVPPVVAEPVVNDPAIISYEPTGDPGLDIALDFVGKLGFGTDNPAMQAAMRGDYSLIEAALAGLGPKAAGWERHIALAKAADAKAADAKVATEAATTAACEKAVGGKDQWATVQAWAVTNASAEEKQAINAMFDLGPIAARMAATAMNVAYQSAPGTVVVPADATRDVAGSAPANGALSKREYAAQVQTLRTTLGRGFETSPEYRALGARLVR